MQNWRQWRSGSFPQHSPAVASAPPSWPQVPEVPKFSFRHSGMTEPATLGIGLTHRILRESSRATDAKLALSAAIAEELARRYSYTDIDTYLDELGLNTPHQFDDETEKSGYVKKTLRGIDVTVLVKIAEDLEVAIPGTRTTILQPPPRRSSTVGPHASRLDVGLAPKAIVTADMAHFGFVPRTSHLHLRALRPRSRGLVGSRATTDRRSVCVPANRS